MRNFIAAALVLVFVGCSKVPVTGRRQLNMLPEKDLMGMALTNYNAFLKENKVVSGSGQAEMVKRVGDKVAKAVAVYLSENGGSNRIKNYKWEFNLVDDPTVNAWCMPGGKVVVYSGIMPVAQDEAGLAVIMGHEIAHAIARHGNERMSNQLLVQAGGVGLSAALSSKPGLTSDLFNMSYGMASNLGMLKYSRSHETEADKMGLVFMAMAGYDPANAITFWERMGKLGGGKPPEFLSTHPASDTRVKDLDAFLPIAMTYYKKP